MYDHLENHLLTSVSAIALSIFAPAAFAKTATDGTAAGTTPAECSQGVVEQGQPQITAAIPKPVVTIAVPKPRSTSLRGVKPIWTCGNKRQQEACPHGGL